MASEFVPEEYKSKLKEWHSSLNPLTLRKQEKDFRKKIDLVNRKLKAGEPLTKNDLQIDNNILIRPIFDSSPLQDKPIYQTSAQYAAQKKIKQAYGIR